MFKNLDKNDTTQLERLVTHHRFAKQHSIVRQGEPASALYIVHGGEIKIARLRRDGSEQVLRLASTGDFFGELSLLSGARSTFDAVVVSDSSLVCSISRADMTQFLARHTSALQAVLLALVERVAQMEEILDGAYAYDSRQKAAALLLSLAARYGRNSAHGTEIRLHMNRAGLASMAGIAQETLSRRLAEFRAEGLIETRGYKWIYIKHEHPLRELLET
jgi:CRP/FNR family transcriptional regulator